MEKLRKDNIDIMACTPLIIGEKGIDNDNINGGCKTTQLQLYESFCNGDKDAFAEIYISNKDTVLKAVKNFCYDDIEAEDITEEAFVKLYLKEAKYKGRGAISTFLIGTARFIFYNRLRAKKKGNNIPLEEFDEYPDNCSIEQSVIDEMVKDDILAVISTMKPVRHQVAKYKLFDKLTNKVIATKLNTSIKNVEYHWSKAKAELQQYLNKEYLK